MKKLLYIPSILLLTTGSCTKSHSGYIGKQKIIIVMTGESNAKGFATNDSLSAGELAVRTATKILNVNNLQFASLQIPINNVSSFQRHGWENGIANCADTGIIAVNTPIYLVKTAQNGSHISDWVMGGTYWNNMVNLLDTAWKQVRVLNAGESPKIFCWYGQGQNDANRNMGSYIWKDSTKLHITNIRSRYGQIPFFITLLPAETFSVYNLRINEICNELPECYPIYTEDCAGTGSHWYPSGMRKMATRIIWTMKQYYTF